MQIPLYVQQKYYGWTRLQCEYLEIIVSTMETLIKKSKFRREK